MATQCYFQWDALLSLLHLSSPTTHPWKRDQCGVHPQQTRWKLWWQHFRMWKSPPVHSPLLPRTNATHTTLPYWTTMTILLEWLYMSFIHPILPSVLSSQSSRGDRWLKLTQGKGSQIVSSMFPRELRKPAREENPVQKNPCKKSYQKPTIYRIVALMWSHRQWPTRLRATSCKSLGTTGGSDLNWAHITSQNNTWNVMCDLVLRMLPHYSAHSGNLVMFIVIEITE